MTSPSLPSLPGFKPLNEPRLLEKPFATLILVFLLRKESPARSSKLGREQNFCETKTGREKQRIFPEKKCLRIDSQEC
ncbi:hypothetical protein GOP47_0029101 [Adiantum capillus-veneris]|nr:hypothetical protein GOP47_0029101 [Adiantum capillus-veneris]